MFNCRIGYYKDTWNTKSVIIRKNYFFNVYSGIYFHMGASDASGITGSIAADGALYKFTRTDDLSTPVPFEVGDIVRLVQDNPVHYVTVLVLVAPTQGSAGAFKFAASFTPSASNIARRVYRIDTAVIEDNLIEMGFYAPAYGANNRPPPTGIDATAENPISDPWILQNVVVRRNLVRHLGGGVDPCYRGDSRGVDVSSCKSLIVESNLIGVEGANWAVRHYQCGHVKALNNLTFAGEPRYALKWDVDPNVHTSELRTDAEDLFLMSFR